MQHNFNTLPGRVAKRPVNEDIAMASEGIIGERKVGPGVENDGGKKITWTFKKKTPIYFLVFLSYMYYNRVLLYVYGSPRSPCSPLAVV